MLKKGEVKPFKTYEEQIELLEKRGLIVNNREAAIEILKAVNYYRFSAFSLTLRNKDEFYKGTTFENIYDLYRFNEDFGQILLKYCLVIEVSFRSYIAYYFSKEYGPLGYLESSHFNNIVYFSNFIKTLDSNINQSDDLSIAHHKNDLNEVYPLWVAIEVISFGTLSKFYKNLNSKDKTSIAKTYTNFKRAYIENWLHCCSYIRNISAHGGRFYNRLLSACPVKLNSKCFPDIKNTSPFAFVIAIFNLLPDKTRKSAFINEIKAVFSKYPFALYKHLEFPENWEKILK